MHIEDYTELLGALVTMGADPFLIENEESAKLVFESMNNGGLYDQLESTEINEENLPRLDLTQEDKVRALYSFFCGAGAALICLSGDF